MFSETIEPADLIGARVDGPSGSAGFVAAVREPEGVTYTLAGGMRRNRAEHQIIWDSGRVEWLPDGITAPMIARARRLAPVPRDEIPARLAAAEAAEAAARERTREASAEWSRKQEAFREEARRRVPSWAKAAIVAELREDDSDSMSDYWGSKTLRRVIIGYSAHARDLFPELRKAAALFPETAHLADAPASAEHREKYSMGAGFYLKDGSRHSTGWQVAKERIYNGPESLSLAEFFDAPAPISAAAPAISGRATISEHIHTKKGFTMWIVSLAERVERDEFDRRRDAAKALGGWYSRPWGATPGGFAFKDEATARGFAGDAVTPGEAAPDAGEAATPAPSGGAATAARLRALADGMESAIADKFADRRANTPKRQRQAQAARIDGAHLKRTQAALRALADRHDAGAVPDALRGVTTKAAVSDLARSRVVYSGGYYDGGRDTGEPANDSEAARALWAMLSPASAEDRAAKELRRTVEALQFAKIPGYFPTPRAIVADMVEAARLPADGCSVCEPSAGSGAILDYLREAAPRGPLFIFERHVTLQKILIAKGYVLHGSDFMEGPELNLPPVDRVLMNPPFEGGQDIEHVRRAFSMLRPGGRLVAIMSPGSFYRSDAKASAFQEWFESMGGERRDIAPGAFKESGTGVGAVLVIVDKEG